MDPALTRRLHDAFKRRWKTRRCLVTFDKYDQSVIYMNTADYTVHRRTVRQAKKAVIRAAGARRQGLIWLQPESENLIPSGLSTTNSQSRLLVELRTEPLSNGRFDKKMMP